VLQGKRFDVSTKQASIHFGILSDGITEIAKTQDLYHAQTVDSLKKILANQQDERIIGWQRFEAIDMNLKSIMEKLQKEGVKTDQILHLLWWLKEKKILNDYSPELMRFKVKINN
jgi:hypothetical protein